MTPFCVIKTKKPGCRLRILLLTQARVTNHSRLQKHQFKKVENLTFFQRGQSIACREQTLFSVLLSFAELFFGGRETTAGIRLRLAGQLLHSYPTKRDLAISVPVDFYFKFSKIFLRIRSDFNRHLDRKYSAKMFLINPRGMTIAK